VDELMMESTVVMRKRAKWKPVEESMTVATAADAQTTGQRTIEEQQRRQRRPAAAAAVPFHLVACCCCLIALCFLVSTASALPPVIRIGN